MRQAHKECGGVMFVFYSEIGFRAGQESIIKLSEKFRDLNATLSIQYVFCPPTGSQYLFLLEIRIFVLLKR